MHVDHRIGFVPRNERMGWLVNHSNLLEVGPASENLTRTVQICSVADSDSRDFTRGSAFATFECRTSLCATHYFRSSPFQSGACCVGVRPIVRLRPVASI